LLSNHLLVGTGGAEFAFPTAREPGEIGEGGRLLLRCYDNDRGFALRLRKARRETITGHGHVAMNRPRNRTLTAIRTGSNA
jgi:hypothetical protein